MKKKITIILTVTFITIVVLLNIIINRNDSNSNRDSLSKVEGTWIADGTQYTFVIGYENGKPVYSDNSTPYYLHLDGKGNYKLEMNENVELGTYSVNEEDISFKTDDGVIMETCSLKNDNELHCNMYASLYIRK